MIDAIRRLPPIGKPTAVGPIQPGPAPKASSGTKADFKEVFEREINAESTPVSFSNHAQSRLLSRQITLSPGQISRLQQGVQQAAQKGARDSLVMLDNLAFIVSVPNRTVVTAVDGSLRTGNVFTQIDSAVIV